MFQEKIKSVLVRFISIIIAVVMLLGNASNVWALRLNAVDNNGPTAARNYGDVPQGSRLSICNLL